MLKRVKSPSSWILGSLFLLTACDPTSVETEIPTVQTMFERWQQQSQHYEYTFQQSCFCLIDYTRPIAITVTDGRIVNARYAENGTAVSDDFRADLNTISEIYLRLLDIESQNPATFDVEYHAEHHYPIKVFIDIDERMADEELQWELSNFRRLN
ncbi:MAG: DUF6174 domain-containing protein [Pseudomonadota bacterium]